MSEVLTFSNPRLRAEFTDWPIGGSNRGQCIFTWCKPKCSTYADRSTSKNFNMVSIHRHDFMSAERSSVASRDDDYAELVAMIESAHTAV